MSRDIFAMEPVEVGSTKLALAPIPAGFSPVMIAHQDGKFVVLVSDLITAVERADYVGYITTETGESAEAIGQALEDLDGPDPFSAERVTAAAEEALGRLENGAGGRLLMLQDQVRLMLPVARELHQVVREQCDAEEKARTAVIGEPQSIAEGDYSVAVMDELSERTGLAELIRLMDKASALLEPLRDLEDEDDPPAGSN